MGRPVVTNQRNDGFSWKTSCAVFFDAVGYSTQIENQHEQTRRKLRDCFDMFAELIDGHGGRVIDKAGDGMFAEFPEVSQALQVAHQFHNHVSNLNSATPIDHRMRFRCGMAYGEVMQEEHLISGPTVNIAARLQQLAEPGTTNIDERARDQVKDDPVFQFTDVGFRILKGLSNPVRIWRVLDEETMVHSASSRLAAEYRVGQPMAEEDDRDPRGLAVLPFTIPPGKDFGEEEDAYMALGLACDIADELSHSHWIKVISPRTSMNYSDEQYQDADIARELKVRYLLKGSVRFAGEAVRISALLVDCVTSEIVWTEKYDRRKASVFEIMDEITNLIVVNIEPEFLRHESQRAAASNPRNVNSWELLMRARWHFWRGTAKHVNLALACAEKALQLEPDSAQTLALLSFCHMSQVWTGLSQDPVFQSKEALRFARLAVNLDDTNPNAHFTLGTALSLSGDVRAAIAAERRALELNSNFVFALGELARLLAFDGKSEEARRTALKAIELSPSDPHISLFVRSLAVASFVDGDYAAAAELALEATAKRPDWFFHHAMVASACGLAGQMEDAKQAMAECRSLLPDYPLTVLKTGHPFTEQKHMDAFLHGLRLAGWDEA